MADAPHAAPRTTRERLLDAAAQLIAELGWAAVTSRAVAERAGVNNGVVHYHFGSMDALRRDATEHATGELMRSALAWFAAAPAALGAYAEMVTAVSRLDPGSAPVAVLLEAMLHAPRDPEVQVLVAGMVARFRGAMESKLRADIAAGRVRDDIDPSDVAVALAGLFDGLLLHAMVERQTPTEAAIDAVAQLLAPPATAP